MTKFNLNVIQLVFLILSALVGSPQDNTWTFLSGSPHGVSLLTFTKDKIYASNRWGLFVSADQGMHWSRIDSLLSSPVGNRCEFKTVMQFDSNIVFVASVSCGLQESTNRGDSWIPLNNRLPDLSGVFDISKGKHGEIYLADGKGYCSADTGKTWYSLGDDFLGTVRFAANRSKYMLYSYIMDGRTGEQRMSLYDEENKSSIVVEHLEKLDRPAIVSSNSDEFFVQDFDGDLFYSTDNGLSWQKSKDAPPAFTLQILQTEGGQLIATTYGDGLYYSSDKGRGWKKIAATVDNSGGGIISIVLDGENQLYIGTPVGVFKSNVSADELCK